MKNILILGAVVIIIGVVSLFVYPGDESGEVVTENTRDDVQEYFNEKLQARVVEETGQPIEGFEPFMFMNVFLGLVPQDFDGVDALLGEYTIKEKELVFVLDDSGPIHSAAQAISEDGMKTLLSNIEKRADTTIATKEEVDGLLLFLGGRE